MVRHEKDMVFAAAENLRGGNGTVEMTHLLEADEMFGKGRLFARNVLKPGVSLGFHKHEGDCEMYYILKGKGLYYDGDEKYEVFPGDLTIVYDNDSHGIENNSDEDLEFIALILYTK